jgi:hypothetical protein
LRPVPRVTASPGAKSERKPPAIRPDSVPVLRQTKASIPGSLGDWLPEFIALEALGYSRPETVMNKECTASTTTNAREQIRTDPERQLHCVCVSHLFPENMVVSSDEASASPGVTPRSRRRTGPPRGASYRGLRQGSFRSACGHVGQQRNRWPSPAARRGGEPPCPSCCSPDRQSTPPKSAPSASWLAPGTPPATGSDAPG